MNTIVKSAVAGTLALASTGAFAIGLPSSNSSDLILIIENVNTPTNVYALDTGISINSIFPSTGFVSGATLNTTAFNGINAAIAASPTLQSFLAANPASGDEWELLGDQYNGAGGAATNQNSKAVGNNKGVFTSIQPGSNISGTTLAVLESMANGINNSLQTGANFGPLLTATESSTGVSCGNASGDCTSKFGLFGAPDMEAPLGTSSSIYMLTSNGTTTSPPQSYIAGTATLGTNGTLTFTQNTTAVPLPAAVWLFGSGLLGLVGVSRRRKIAA
jgi:hypothetical protein